MRARNIFIELGILWRSALLIKLRAWSCGKKMRKNPSQNHLLERFRRCSAGAHRRQIAHRGRNHGCPLSTRRRRALNGAVAGPQHVKNVG
jgi:hypothetical protein